MPANLTAQYREAEAVFKAAVTREEKLAALEDMLRLIPKHKGTEKLQADLRSRISKLKKEPEKKGGARAVSHRIPHEGGGQVALVGPPNAGKSSLVAALTKAQPEVADYPMSTREATPGMMPFGDIAFQLIDLPPLWDGHVEPWVYDLARTADLAWVVLSSDDPLGGLELVERLLAQRAIQLEPAAGLDRGVEESGAGAAAVGAGVGAGGGPDAARASGMHRGGDGESGPEAGGDGGGGARETGNGAGAEAASRSDAGAGTRRPGWRYLPAFLVLTGLDRPGARDDLAVFAELLGGEWPWIAVSAVTGEGFAALGERTFDALGIIRVYTKEPGHEPDLERPFTLPIGATVETLAREIHGEIAEQLKFARLWGHAAFDGQRVRGDHVLADGDVVELRT